MGKRGSSSGFEKTAEMSEREDVFDSSFSLSTTKDDDKKTESSTKSKSSSKKK